MRRTFNPTNHQIADIISSKIKFTKVLTILDKVRGDADSLEFSASEVGLSGPTLSRMACYGILSIVRVEDCWYQIDDDTMKKGSKNIYCYNINSKDVLSIVNMYKKSSLEQEIEYLQRVLADKISELAEM